jgi:hypothetical protein
MRDLSREVMLSDILTGSHRVNYNGASIEIGKQIKIPQKPR